MITISINLFLDDLRPCPKGFVVARTVEDAITLMMSNTVKYISLDHDLGGEDGSYTKTGYDFCKWLIEEWMIGRMKTIEAIYLHTSNPVGRMNMHQLLSRYKLEHIKIHNSPHPYWMFDE